MNNISCAIFLNESDDTTNDQSNGIRIAGSDGICTVEPDGVSVVEPTIKLERVNLHTLLETFKSIPWQDPTNFAETFVDSENDSENRELFLVGQYDDGTFWLDFKVQKRVKLLSFIPYTKKTDLHLSSIKIREVEDCINIFFSYPHESLVEWIKAKQKEQKKMERYE